MESAKHSQPGPQASARHTEEGERFNRTLFSALDAIEASHISYALIGGVAASGLGRPRSTHDIDIFVRPEDAESTLTALTGAGFETERTDDRWLFKGFRDNHMVDIIFKSWGDIYFDDEMEEHIHYVNFHGRRVRVVNPVDLIIIKCAVHSESGPHHWHDALALLSHAKIDWAYLLRRSHKAPRRLLALLIYAQSNDILIPNLVIVQLSQTIFSDIYLQKSAGSQTGRHEPTARHRPTDHIEPPGHGLDEYVAGQVKEALAKDERTGMLDVKVCVEHKHILVKGECQSESQRSSVSDVINEIAPQHDFDNQLRIAILAPPETEEVIQ
jgi:predicted nucleotidyltransferase